MARSTARLDRARRHAVAHRRRLRQRRIPPCRCVRISQIVNITALGAEGDGVATTAAGAQVFIPQALPGETRRIAEGAPPEPVTLLPNRLPPPRPDDEPCGGWVARHMPPAMYEAWKRDLLVRALRQQDIGVEIGPLITVPGHTRRRATFNAAR